jgi:phage tail-like protein
MATETGKRDDPYGQYNFLVEIDSVTRAGFTEASGLTIDTDAMDYREGADKTHNVRKLRGLTKYTNISLKRGYTQDKELWNWYKATINGSVERRSLEVALLNENRDEVLRWRVSEAWIAKMDMGPFNATTSEAAIETIELFNEGIELL